MKTHVVYISFIVALVATILLMFSTQNERTEYKQMVITDYQCDTLYLKDTVFIEKPTPVYIESKPDTVYIESLDTTAVMQRETKVYQDSTYKAQISGFQPLLDWIEVYSKTYYITEYKETKTVKKQRLTHGIQVGVGYGVINKKADLFIGYGIQYNF